MATTCDWAIALVTVSGVTYMRPVRETISSDIGPAIGP